MDPTVIERTVAEDGVFRMNEPRFVPERTKGYGGYESYRLSARELERIPAPTEWDKGRWDKAGVILGKRKIPRGA